MRKKTKWKLEIRAAGKWVMVGMYGLGSVPQMAAAYGRLAAIGYKPYADVRVVRMWPHD